MSNSEEELDHIGSRRSHKATIWERWVGLSDRIKTAILGTAALSGAIVAIMTSWDTILAHLPNSKFTSVGLRVYPKPLEAVSAEVAPLLKQMGKGATVTFAGINFYLLTDDLERDLVTAVCRGVNVRFLVLKPDQKLVTDYSNKYRHDPEKVKDEVRTTFRNLHTILRKIEADTSANTHGLFEVRTLDFIPHQRMYWFDRGSGKQEAVVVQYAMGVMSSDSPALRFSGSSDLGKFYEASLLWHWQQGVDARALVENGQVLP